MSTTMYAVLGIVMMVLVMAVLISGKTDPIIPMITIPIVFALIMGGGNHIFTAYGESADQ